MSKLMGGRAGLAVGALAMLLASPLLAPQLLAFPHRHETAIGTVWSDEPFDPLIMTDVARRVSERMATTPLAGPNERRPIFITDGGWRWVYLANVSQGAFAITRPFTRAVVLNRTDPDTGTVSNGAEIGGARTIEGVLAHEFTHGLIRRRYGVLIATTLPSWKVEGYCDHVADESSLSPGDVARLEAAGEDHPALPYFHGRRRVAATLARNGGSVDALFEQD